jgi:hypothetical protein
MRQLIYINIFMIFDNPLELKNFLTFLSEGSNEL